MKKARFGNAKSTKLSRTAAVRIQGHADRTGTNQGFKARAQAAAAINSTVKGKSSSK